MYLPTCDSSSFAFLNIFCRRSSLTWPSLHIQTSNTAQHKQKSHISSSALLTTTHTHKSPNITSLRRASWAAQVQSGMKDPLHRRVLAPQMMESLFAFRLWCKHPVVGRVQHVRLDPIRVNNRNFFGTTHSSLSSQQKHIATTSVSRGTLQMVCCFDHPHCLECGPKSTSTERDRVQSTI